MRGPATPATPSTPDSSGFKRIITTMASESASETMIPGPIPAANSLPILSSVSTPYTTISSEGGISIPRSALEATMPSANFLL